LPSEKVAGQWVPESSVRLLNNEAREEPRDSSKEKTRMAFSLSSREAISN
jgi:hypothetical protein